jgi:hypothetical protein
MARIARRTKETLPECCKPEGKEIRERLSVPLLGTQQEVRETGAELPVPSLGMATRSLWLSLVSRGHQKLYPDLASLGEALPSEHEEPPPTYSTWPRTDRSWSKTNPFAALYPQRDNWWTEGHPGQDTFETFPVNVNPTPADPLPW